MYVLGIGGLMHDYNCGLVDVSQGRLALREAERFSRKKHHVLSKSDEILAPILKCCAELSTTIDQIEVVAYAHTDSFPIKAEFRQLFPSAKHIDIDHHTAHIAGAFFSSSLDNALIVSLDGYGDGSSAMFALGRGNHIEEIGRVDEINSIGLEYMRATWHLGLGGYGSEGKTQGLASYGEPVWLQDYLNEIDIDSSGYFRLSDQLKSENNPLSSEGGYLTALLLENDFLPRICPRRIDPEPLQDHHMNLAASVQAMLEHVSLTVLQNLRNKYSEPNLILTGGVSLNSSMNGAIAKSGMFDYVLPFPLASDRGTGLGAALYYTHQHLDEERFPALDNMYLGDQYPEVDIPALAVECGLEVTQTNEYISLIANEIAKGKIAAWYHGRSELGARALGNRSIVANPHAAEMKNILNARVKHREWFRPFAPTILNSAYSQYFLLPETQADLSTMTVTVDATDKATNAAPAAIHVDKTARVQVVTESANPAFHSLISEFSAITGTPMLINTSFNDNGEPIVETPKDAFNTFLKCDIDVLSIDNYVIGKPS